jgi:hypothetical protein
MLTILIGLLMCLSPVASSSSSGSVSDNWAGYVQGGTYTMVGGEWTVPLLDCAATPGGLTADWVGVNGWDSNGGLFQDGTMSQCSSSGVQVDYAWWTDEGEGYSVELLYGVAPGDVIFARVWEEAGGSWAYSVRDLTTGQSASAPGVSTPYGAGVTAEWIAEDPGCPPAPYHSLCRLADFGTVHFSHAQYVGTNADATAIEMIIRSTGAPQVMPSVMVGSSWDVTYE